MIVVELVVCFWIPKLLGFSFLDFTISHFEFFTS